MSLMLSEGYDAVSVDMVAEAAGIGRTTFFRYFGSKAGVVWAAFDDTIRWLEESIAAAAPEDDPFDVIRTGIVSSARSAFYDSEVWLERFALLDTNPSLRGETYEHWERWTGVLVDYLVDRTDGRLPLAAPMAIAGACRGMFVADLRDLPTSDADREAVLERLDADLASTLDLMRPLLAG
jgi:AcrR family transcriptional regulator